MLFLKHLLRFFRELVRYCVTNRVLWPIPLILLLLLIALLVMTGAAAAPYIYTLF